MDDENSLNDEVTFTGKAPRQFAPELSLGDEPTRGEDDAAGVDTILDDIEVVDLESRYKFEGKLGQGGMGAVLLATDTRLGRKVAIKQILQEHALRQASVVRFFIEAKAIAAINHPSILQIYDCGRSSTGPYIVMEHADGGSVLDRCRERCFPVEDAISIACHVCDGLTRAHDQGIIHRDIKPSNILLTKDGYPKLADFGLAKVKAELVNHDLSVAGAVIGTPHFMPPEQHRHTSEVDSRSDLWSLAATVYQMVTGRSPKVIRLHELPQELQSILAKALEDEKDARYQSAREFRDALKTSLRIAAPTVLETAEGQCPACGVKNDSTRRFCRGCGESLEAPCLFCSKSMPMWEEICGSCGAKQTPLEDERRQGIAAKQAEAEELLGDCEFDRAIGIATALRAEGHPKLRFLSGWVEAFLATVETARTKQTREAAAAIDEAGKHEAAFDYLSARVAVESIPAPLQAVILPGMREPATALLERVKKKQAETLRLERLIKERVVAKQLDELLPEVERFVVLRPDRKDVSKIREQLLDRRTRQEAARDEAVAAAQASLASHNYEQAQAALAALAAAVVTPEVTQLRERVEGLLLQVRMLSKQIKERVAGKTLDGLLPVVEEYLRLKPEDDDAASLRTSLEHREERFAAEIAAKLHEARALATGCRFEKAVKLLRAVPEARRSPAVVELLDRVTSLGALRAPVLRALKDAAAGGYAVEVAGSREYCDALSAADLTDPEFAALVAKAAASAMREKRARRLLFITGATAAGSVAVIMMLGARWWMRESERAASLASAIAESRWEDALAIEPDNAAALVGRARQKLAATPANVVGAFADLDLAGRQPGAAENVKPVQAEAHAWRAEARAQADELDQAAQDLRAAQRGGASADVVARASAAIANGWLGRGGTAITKGDTSGARRAADAALAAGADAGVVGSLRARGMVLESRSLLKSDVDGAVERMLAASLLDKALVEAALGEPGFAAVKAGVVGKYRARFDKAVAREAWDEALAIAGTTEAIDPSSATWVSEAVGRVPPAAIPKVPPLVNSIGIALKLLPAGTFTMGQAWGDSDETPHEVTLSKPYYLGVTEVTNAQWQAVMGRVPSNWKDDDRPVEQVSWEDAVEFCRKLSAFSAEKQAGRVYRLPTEAEWEYACRAGTETRYSFGDDESRLGEYAWYYGNSGNETHAVGTKKPNAWGLFDMHGNVREWCSDWYGEYPKGAVTDPQGPSHASVRVLRGGSWLGSASLCRSAHRGTVLSLTEGYLGFRLALSPTGAEPPEAAPAK